MNEGMQVMDKSFGHACSNIYKLIGQVSYAQRSMELQTEIK